MILYLVAFVVGVIGTMAAIVFGYVEFSDLFENWKLALGPFFVWPWVSYPILLTLSSVAYPFVIHTLTPNPTRDQMMGSIMGFTSISVLVGIFLAYPGREALALWSDGSLGTVIVVTGIIQFLVASVVHSEIVMMNEDRANKS